MCDISRREILSIQSVYMCVSMCAMQVHSSIGIITMHPRGGIAKQAGALG